MNENPLPYPSTSLSTEPQQATQPVKLYKFFRAEDPSEEAFFQYTTAPIKSILHVLDGFRCKYREIDKDFYFIDAYELIDYAHPDPDKYVLVAVHPSEMPDWPYKTYTHGNVSIRLHDTLAEHQHYYSHKWFH